ncbi:ATP-dependent nuclease [Agrobacterium sp. NPDC089420]|uniref:ATP-dependent nuclease n=1 Tax=Agrobacterium sp. NPDC089420 TaxID=3363918 RepID=UPI00384BC69A
MATIAVELEKVTDLTLFLVEEPEAHLHPQVQAAVLSFLDEQAEKSRKPRADIQGPAGELQVIVATHSPNLSAWVESKKLVFFRSFLPSPDLAEAAVAEEEPHALAGVPAEIMPEIEPNPVMPVGRPRRETRCIPLSALALNPVERRKVDRYLDVTKSALLFGGRVLLVEGIAEALLLPVIAKKVVLKGEAEKLRLFRSAVFVPIDGVDFEPYAKLLLSICVLQSTKRWASVGTNRRRFRSCLIQEGAFLRRSGRNSKNSCGLWGSRHRIALSFRRQGEQARTR